MATAYRGATERRPHGTEIRVVHDAGRGASLSRGSSGDRQPAARRDIGPPVHRGHARGHEGDGGRGHVQGRDSQAPAGDDGRRGPGPPRVGPAVHGDVGGGRRERRQRHLRGASPSRRGLRDLYRFGHAGTGDDRHPGGRAPPGAEGCRHRGRLRRRRPRRHLRLPGDDALRDRPRPDRHLLQPGTQGRAAHLQPSEPGGRRLH